MVDLTETLIERKKELEKIIDEAMRQINVAPAGKIQIHSKGNCYRYYHCNYNASKSGGTIKKYIPIGEKNIAQAIIQKDYADKILKYATEEKAIIETLLDNNSTQEMYRIFENMHPGRKALIRPFILSDEEFVKQWLKYAAGPVNTYEITSDIYTENNEHVRSKSEKIIADKLALLKIPYKYEEPLSIGGKTIYPDFTVLCKKKRKTYYWEHLGRMSNESYVEKAMDKLDFYQKNGIILGDKLIVSFETQSRPLSVSVLNEIIYTFLI